MDKLLKKLLHDGVLRKDQCIVLQTEHNIGGEPVDALLKDSEFLSNAQMCRYTKASSAAPFSIDEFVPDTTALAALSEALARELQAVPLFVDTKDSSISIAVPEGISVLHQDKIQRQLKNDMQLKFVFVSLTDFARLLDTCYGFNLAVDAILEELHELSSSASKQANSYQLPIVRLVDALLYDAVLHQASDIHFCPEDKHVQIRLRIDGVLSELRCIHIANWQAMLVRLKILSRMDIAETRLPQDGQFSKRINGVRVEFRSACFPVRCGENVVLRILDRRTGVRTLGQLALAAREHAMLKQFAHKPAGLLLVCGPTGMGKTTTLYALLQELDSTALSIMTLEDPIEFSLQGIRQTRVSQHGKLSYAEGVRGVLRQDPDVLLIGEIRDQESCDMAIRAAMTGHRVFTTLHAANCVGAISRLQELCGATNTLASVLTGVVAQRLLRCICKVCNGRYSGCDACAYTGFKGRLAVLEMLPMTAAIVHMINDNASSTELAALAEKEGMQTLSMLGERKVQQNATTQKELRRVLGVI